MGAKLVGFIFFPQETILKTRKPVFLQQETQLQANTSTSAVRAFLQPKPFQHCHFPGLRDAPAQWEECRVTPGRAQHPPGLAVRVLRRQTHEEPEPGCAGKHEPRQVKSARCIYCSFGDSFAFALPLSFAPSQLVFQDWQGLGGPRGKLGCSHTADPPAFMQKFAADAQHVLRTFSSSPSHKPTPGFARLCTSDRFNQGNANQTPPSHLRLCH